MAYAILYTSESILTNPGRCFHLQRAIALHCMLYITYRITLYIKLIAPYYILHSTHCIIYTITYDAIRERYDYLSADVHNLTI